MRAIAVMVLLAAGVANAGNVSPELRAKAEAAVAIKLVKQGTGGVNVAVGNATHNVGRTTTRNGNIRVGVTTFGGSKGPKAFNEIYNVKTGKVTADPSDGRRAR